MMMSVPAGVACLAQRFGKDIGALSPGLQCKPPWYRIAYIVSQQACCYDAPVMSCPTSDDVRVSVDVTLVFQITDASSFIYRLGAKNFDEFLTGTVDEAIRNLVRSFDHKNVYAMRGDKTDHMLQLLNDKFQHAGVTFHDAKITSVWLPDQLANAVEITTKLEKGMDKRIVENEFEMEKIRLQSVMDVENINRRQEQVKVAEAGRKRRSELEHDQRVIKVEEEGKVAMIVADGQVQVAQKRVDTELMLTKTKLETWKLKELAEAHAKALELKAKADHEEEVAQIEALAKLEKMNSEAEIITCDAAVEAETWEHKKAMREHELLLKEKGILSNFAEKGAFNLIGTPGDRLVNSVLAGSAGVAGR